MVQDRCTSLVCLLELVNWQKVCLIGLNVTTDTRHEHRHLPYKMDWTKHYTSPWSQRHKYKQIKETHRRVEEFKGVWTEKREERGYQSRAMWLSPQNRVFNCQGTVQMSTNNICHLPTLKLHMLWSSVVHHREWQSRSTVERGIQEDIYTAPCSWNWSAYSGSSAHQTANVPAEITAYFQTYSSIAKAASLFPSHISPAIKLSGFWFWVILPLWMDLQNTFAFAWTDQIFFLVVSPLFSCCFFHRWTLEARSLTIGKINFLCKLKKA